MLFIQEEVITQIQAEAEQTDDECCGFLLGWETDTLRTITMAVPARNIAEDRRHNFLISSSEYINAEQFADWNNMRLLGIYHSHPNHPAMPSEADRISAQPYFSYLIASLKNRKMAGFRSWLLNNNFKFDEQPVSIIYSNKLIYGHSNHPNTAA